MRQNQLSSLFGLAMIVNIISCSCGYIQSNKITRASTKLQSTSYDETKESLPTRRQTLELAFGALGLGTTFAATRENKPTDYGLWGILPIGTYKTKKP